MSQPRLSKLNIWERHEQRVLKILLEALTILQAKAELSLSEINLNRELYFCLLEANRKMGKEAFGYAPTCEAKNPPDPDDEQRTVRENKIPDFYWGYLDDMEPDPRRSARNFYIECKRLGKPPRTDWILNENYVHHGICRFMTKEHGYDRGEQSAVMIGYVQSMELDDILREVNTTAMSVSVPKIKKPVKGWKIKGVSHLQQKLHRAFPISPFILWHLWVDLRISM